MTRNEQFAERMTSIEVQFAGIDQTKAAELSDKEAGVERLVNALDFDNPKVRRAIFADIAKMEEELKKRFEAAIVKLILNGLSHTIPTLLKIMRNRGNRQATIREIMAEEGLNYEAARKRYNRHRDTLLAFFASTPANN